MTHSTIERTPFSLDRPIFHVPDLTWSKPPYFPTSPRAGEFLSRLVKDHYLILGGKSNQEKRQLARHMAWLLSDHLHLEGTTDVVVEWIRNSGLQALEISLENDAPPIVILPDLEPSHLGHDLEKIRKLAEQSGRYLLVTTDKASSDWMLTDAQKQDLWVEAAPEDIYDPSYLHTCLEQYLEDYHGHLPGNLTPQTELYHGMTLAEVAQRLGAPFHIRAFLTEIARCERLPDRSGIEELFDRIRSDEQALHRYLNGLDPRGKLLVVAIVLFEGLSVESFFAAVNYLLETVWLKQVPNVAMFDGVDLARLREAIGIQEDVIQFATRNRRTLLIGLIWKEHLELIKATLPSLVSLAVDSVRYESVFHPVLQKMDVSSDEEFKVSRWLDESFARNLFGSGDHCRRIRSVISETLGLLGRQSAAVVERSLLELAANDATQIRDIAARALSSWREMPHSGEILSRLLKAWRQDIRFLREIEDLIDSDQQRGRARDYILMTLAQTVGQAVAYDQPNVMHPELEVIFKSLGEEHSPTLTLCFDQKTIPFVMQRHLLQQASQCEKWLSKGKRVSAVAQGLALAFSFQPEAAETLVSRWRAEVAGVDPADGNRPPGRREALLACIALSYGYREDNGRALIVEAYQDWWQLLHNEQSPLIRKAILEAIYWRSVFNFTELEPCLQELAVLLSQDEQNNIVDMLTYLYLKQRRGLSGGETSFRYQGYNYPCWIDGARDLTEIENVLNHWEGLTDKPSAQRIAALTRQAIREGLDYAEDLFLQDFCYARDLKSSSEAGKQRLMTRTKRLNMERNGIFQTMLVMLVVTNKRLQPKILALMPGLWRDPKRFQKMAINLKKEERAGPEIIWYIEKLILYYRLSKIAGVVAGVVALWLVVFGLVS